MARTAGFFYERYSASRRCFSVFYAKIIRSNIMSSIPEFFRSRLDAPSHLSSVNVDLRIAMPCEFNRDDGLVSRINGLVQCSSALIRGSTGSLRAVLILSWLRRCRSRRTRISEEEKNGKLGLPNYLLQHILLACRTKRQLHHTALLPKSVCSGRFVWPRKRHS